MHFTGDNIKACKNLWTAVLQTAIIDLHSKHDKTRQHESREWFKSKNRELPGFLATCEALGLNPEIIKENVMNRTKPIKISRAMRTQLCFNCGIRREVMWMSYVPLYGAYLCRRCEKKDTSGI